MKNVALQIKEKAKHLQQMQWPSTIEEACEKMDDNLLTEFVSWLRSPNPNEVKDLPKVYAIASLLQSFITRKRTNFQVQLTNIIYGLTRSRELVDVMKKMGLGIS